LFAAVVAAVVVGGVLAGMWLALIRAVVGSDATSMDVLAVAFTAVVGVGGAVALVVAYRRQGDLEQGRFVERFGAAAAQLGSPDPAVRIAGVYAMAGVADESTTFSRRQQCIDVLCGYLRLPYDPDYGSSHHTELVTATKRLPSESATQSIEQQHTQRRTIRQNDREVRQTIVRVITAHLRDHADIPWSDHDFDFTTAIFENADFQNARFRGKNTSFEGATFSGGRTSFEKARFSGHVRFKGATFSGERTWFVLATFSGVTSFEGATFSGERTSFAVATFSGERTSFEGATFSGERTSFEQPRRWQNVIFDWDNNLNAVPACIHPRKWPPPLGSDS